jgi:hypothetical protein
MGSAAIGRVEYAGGIAYERNGNAAAYRALRQGHGAELELVRSSSKTETVPFEALTPHTRFRRWRRQRGQDGGCQAGEEAQRGECDSVPGDAGTDAETHRRRVEG